MEKSTLEKITRESVVCLMYIYTITKTVKDTSLSIQAKKKILDVMTDFAEETNTLIELEIALQALDEIIKDHISK